MPTLKILICEGNNADEAIFGCSFAKPARARLFAPASVRPANVRSRGKFGNFTLDVEQTSSRSTHETRRQPHDPCPAGAAKRDADPRQNYRHEDDTVERAAARSPFTQDFANAIAACSTFDSAWNALQAHAYQFGITQVNFGVIAEPPGRFTNGARLLKSTLGNELLHLYEQAGGTSTDPCTHHFATHETEKFVDSDFVIKRQLRYAPKPLRTLAESFLDTHLRHILCLPGRDHITGAPLGFAFSLSPDAASRFRHCPREDIDQLRKATQIFWHSVQRKGLMAEFATLSNRQREALTCAARGYTTTEMAEHMGVSTRSTEKTLAAARERLGASTTTAAVYRAMVYRALT